MPIRFNFDGRNYELRFEHIRFDLGVESKKDHRAPAKAVTVVSLTEDRPIEAGQHIYSGMAFCSWKDQFNRKIGRSVALGRMCRAIGDPALVMAIDTAYIFRR